MKRLLENKLIFGELLAIDEPHLIERYNKALEGFGLKRVKLERFSIDMTGYSPEVAQALANPEYLDPNGVNRRFIILTPEQETLPVVNTQFSNTEQLMLAFFEKNRREIFAVTIKDVLFGEIEDSVLEVDNIDDLMSIEQVEFRVSTSADQIIVPAYDRVNLRLSYVTDNGWNISGFVNNLFDSFDWYYASTDPFVGGDVFVAPLAPRQIGVTLTRKF